MAISSETSQELAAQLLDLCCGERPLQQGADRILGGLNQFDFPLLYALSRQKKKSARYTDLGQNMFLPCQNLSAKLRRMEERDLLIRSQDPHKGNMGVATLTKEGERQVNLRKNAVLDLISQALEGMEEQDIRDMIRIRAALSASLARVLRRHNAMEARAQYRKGFGWE